MTLQEMFENCHDDFIRFESVENKLSQRADLHAFLLLDKLVPGDAYMIACAVHDEFYLSVDCEALAKVVTQEQVLELTRCGVRYSASEDSLCMFA